MCHSAHICVPFGHNHFEILFHIHKEQLCKTGRPEVNDSLLPDPIKSCVVNKQLVFEDSKYMVIWLSHLGHIFTCLWLILFTVVWYCGSTAE